MFVSLILLARISTYAWDNLMLYSMIEQNPIWKNLCLEENRYFIKYFLALGWKTMYGIVCINTSYHRLTVTVFSSLNTRENDGCAGDFVGEMDRKQDEKGCHVLVIKNRRGKHNLNERSVA